MEFLKPYFFAVLSLI